MLTKTSPSIWRILPALAILMSISITVQLQAQVQASVTKEPNFSGNVVLNKPGVTFDLTPMEDYAEQGTLKIVDKQWVKKDKINKNKWTSCPKCGCSIRMEQLSPILIWYI